MLRVTGVIVSMVVLALSSECAYGQPTHDDFFHWRDGRDLLEQMAMNLQRVIIYQERQQRAQEERMDRLEQMLNESVQGQQVSQHQQQQLETEMTRYASLQHQYYQQHHQQQLAINSQIDNITAKLEAVSDNVKQQPTEESILRNLMTGFRNLSTHLADAQQSYDQKRQNQTADQLEIITASMSQIKETMTTKMLNAVTLELSDFVSNASKKIAETEQRYAELWDIQIGSMIQVSNVTLKELRDVAHQINTQQLQQRARDDTLLGMMIELTNSTTESRLSLLAKCEQIQHNVNENISQLLGALSTIRQGQRQLVELATNDLYQHLEVVALESRELLANNMSTMLTGIGESCRANIGFEEAVQTHKQQQNELLELYQQAVVNNVSKLLEIAHAQALVNITTHLGEIREKNEELSEERSTHDLIFIEMLIEILSNLTQSQQQLLIEVGREMERKMNETLIVSEQNHAEIVRQITDKSDEIQVHLTRIQEQVRMHSRNNITAMLADTKDTCASVGSSVSTTKEMMVGKFHEQRRLVLANAQLMVALNQTWMTSAQQSQLQNSKYHHPTTEYYISRFRYVAVSLNRCYSKLIKRLNL